MLSADKRCRRISVLPASDYQYNKKNFFVKKKLVSLSSLLVHQQCWSHAKAFVSG
jgi:hypothetical protein